MPVSADDVRARIAEARRRRQDSAERNEDDEDTAAWVARVRSKTKRDRLRERQSAFDEQDEAQGEVAAPEYSSRDLTGIAIGHDVSAFDEGREVVLTLKDESVLDDSGNVRSDEDKLVNVEMQDVETAQRNNARRLQTKAYDATDTSEFDKDGNPRQRTILAQYDDDAKESSFRLGQDGAVNIDREKEKEEIKMRLAGMGGTAVKTNLASESLYTESSAYLTKEEYEAKFKKSKKKRKKKMRKRDSSILDEIGEADGDDDHGSRVEKRSRSTAKTTTNDAKKEPSLLDAMETEGDEEDQRPQDFFALAEEEDEIAVARTKRLMSKKRIPPAAEVAEKVRSEAAKTKDETLGGDSDGEVDPSSSSGLVFNSASEFVRGIEFDTAAPKRKEIADAPTTSSASPPRNARNKEEAPKGNAVGTWTTAENEEKRRESDESEGEARASDEEEDPEDVLLEEEHLDVSSSTAAALRLLRQQNKFGTELAGRTNDIKRATHDPNLQDADKIRGVLLEYRDQWGRKMTPKEAFNDMCYKFHNVKPGTKKKEKLHKDYLRHLKEQRTGQEDLASVLALETKKEKTKAPFVVLTGKGSDIGALVGEGDRDD